MRSNHTESALLYVPEALWHIASVLVVDEYCELLIAVEHIS
jgi:hypothetical protein